MPSATLLLALTLPGVVFACIALVSWRRVARSRGIELLVVSVVACLPSILALRIDPLSEAAAWSSMPVSLEATSFWVLAGLSVTARRWPPDSPTGIAASITVWVLTVVFAALQIAYSSGSPVGLIGFAPVSLLLIALLFGGLLAYLRSVEAA